MDAEWYAEERAWMEDIPVVFNTSPPALTASCTSRMPSIRSLPRGVFKLRGPESSVTRPRWMRVRQSQQEQKGGTDLGSQGGSAAKQRRGKMKVVNIGDRGPFFRGAEDGRWRDGYQTMSSKLRVAWLWETYVAQPADPQGTRQAQHRSGGQ